MTLKTIEIRVVHFHNKKHCVKKVKIEQKKIVVRKIKQRLATNFLCV